MKKRFITGSVAAVVLVVGTLGWHSHSLAGATHSQFPVIGDFFVECAGEVFALDGIGNSTVNLHVSSDGRLHGTDKLRIDGTFTGLTSGNLYRVHETVNANFNAILASFPRAFTETINFVARPQGDYPRIHGKHCIHRIVNAKGEITVSMFEFFEFTCDN